MKVAVVGAGGIGGYFGGRIAASGHDVTFVARGEHLQAIREKGLKVISILGDLLIPQVDATDDIRSIGKADLVILGVKAWQVKDVAEQLKDVIDDRTTILPLQNGIMAAQELGERLGEKNIVGGLCRIISKIESPGIIRHSGLEPLIVFGELDNGKSSRILKIRKLFESARIASRIADDIQEESWNKFMAICVSGLLAVARAPYGKVRELKETRTMMRDLLQEIREVALKSGQMLERNVVEKTMALIDSYPYESMSSLTRDVLEGRPSEIEYQNGTVVQWGEKYNVPVPVNRFIYGCILPMELAARAKANN
jgi:2-dehydropantoate 2-reductase